MPPLDKNAAAQTLRLPGYNPKVKNYRMAPCPSFKSWLCKV